MAETGAVDPLEAEIQSLGLGGAAISSPIVGPCLAVSPGSESLALDVSPTRPLVTMLAPSPDWFVGVSGFDLCDADSWHDEIEIDLFAYDAGTDSGTSYTSANADTQPHEPITRIELPPFVVAGSVSRVGTLTISRLTTARAPTPIGEWVVGPVAPNPSRGRAWIGMTTSEPHAELVVL